MDEGVDGITAINTVRATMIDVETQRPVLSHRTGGLSGSAIRPIALRCVYELSEEFEVPIMGVGASPGEIMRFNSCSRAPPRSR